jgi:L-ascorbate metabolism protein UlaG (beta-lactamase superfamily)
MDRDASPTTLLEYFGHAAFRWTTPAGVSVAIDPYDNDESRPWMRWFAAPVPLLRADYVLVTHNHFDHRAIHRVTGATTVGEPRELSKGDARITGIGEEHVPGHGPPGMRNVIFLVETSGLRCCHWGDNRASVPRETLARLGRVDVLMVPVDDSCHLLQLGEVDAIIDALEPRLVIPMHYFHPYVGDAQSPLKGIAEWLKRGQMVHRAMPGAVELRPDVLPAQSQVWVMDPLASADD